MAVNLRRARVAAACGAAVLTAIAGEAIAAATVTWTVRPGGSLSAKSGNLTITDTRTGATFTCASSMLTGTLKGGSGLPGTGIGSVTAAGMSECGSLGAISLTPAALPWHVNFTRYNATKRVVTGSISHIQIRVRGNSFTCSAVLDGTNGTARDGTLKFSYANSSGVLSAVPTGGNLHFYRIDGCAGIFLPGDPATLTGTFTVSPKQAITSP